MNYPGRDELMGDDTPTWRFREACFLRFSRKVARHEAGPTGVRLGGPKSGKKIGVRYRQCDRSFRSALTVKTARDDVEVKINDRGVEPS